VTAALQHAWAAADGDVAAFARGLDAAQVGTVLDGASTVDALLADLPTKSDASTLSDLLTASGADPGRFAAAVAGDTRPSTLPALMAVADVGARLRQLEMQGNLAAAPIRQAWTEAVGYRAFAAALSTPPLIALVTAQTGQVSERLERLAATQPQLGGALVDLWARAHADLGTFRHEVEDWFDREMARVSGWYFPLGAVADARDRHHPRRAAEHLSHHGREGAVGGPDAAQPGRGRGAAEGGVDDDDRRRRGGADHCTAGDGGRSDDTRTRPAASRRLERTHVAWVRLVPAAATCWASCWSASRRRSVRRSGSTC